MQSIPDMNHMSRHESCAAAALRINGASPTSAKLPNKKHRTIILYYKYYTDSDTIVIVIIPFTVILAVPAPPTNDVSAGPNFVGS